MAKVIDVKIDSKTPEELPVPKGKEELQNIIESYKLQNPVKYAAKKASLEARLKALK